MNTSAEGHHGGSKQIDVADEAYWSCSTRPLQILVFLLPFIVLYELGMMYLLREDRGTITNVAHEWIIQFMRLFDVDMFGLSLPAVAVVLVLVVWHIFTKSPWRVSWHTFLLMFLESILLAIPLILLSRLIQQLIPLIASQGEIIGSLNPVGRIAISIGAGLYEELVFRMLVVFVIHTLLVDVLRLSNLIGSTIAIVISAVLFAVYHPVWAPDGTASMGRLVFYLLAGLWFGVLYVVRGFGIVVAVHAFYDMATLLDAD